jgi:hypothetical protein
MYLRMMQIEAAIIFDTNCKLISFQDQNCRDSYSQVLLWFFVTMTVMLDHSYIVGHSMAELDRKDSIKGLHLLGSKYKYN